jgi:exosortase
MNSIGHKVVVRDDWLWAVVLAAIWVPVIYLLGAQWSVYEAYNYGWAVPFLCLFLAGQKLPTRPAATTPELGKTAFVLLVVAGLVFSVMRILQEANPLWRVASWGLALAAVAMALLTIYLASGAGRTAHFFFPIVFFLVAVPWPTPVEDALIQTLTRFNSGVAVEVLNVAGVPALLHGNVIEVSTGMVGIDEACSGIRSFQATLMIALFFGAFYQMRGARRWWLLAAGSALALGFNLIRTLLLVFVAAQAGLPAMENWHDPTGAALLVGCFLCLWGAAVWLARKKNIQKSEIEGQAPGINVTPFPHFRVSMLARWLVVWAVALAVANEAWFRCHEVRTTKALSWAARWPAANPTLRTNIIPKNALHILQCNEHSSASWTDDDGISWQAFFLRWLPAGSFYGRTQEALSKSHNPADCLTAAGLTLQARLEPVLLPVRPGLSLWFSRYIFTAEDHPLYVFFSQTEDMTDPVEYSLRTTHLARLRSALAGSRNYGQNNFEVALSGPGNQDDALRLFSARLPALIQTRLDANRTTFSP